MVGIVFPDVEAFLVTYLAGALDARPEPYSTDVAVRNHVPSAWSGRLVVVRDDGGPHLGDVRGVARLGVQVWAEDEPTVSDLANLASAIVGASANSGPVVRARSSRPYTVADPRPKQYFTAELLIRGTDL